MSRLLQVLPILMVHMFSQIQHAPGPDFRRVGNSLKMYRYKQSHLGLCCLSRSFWQATSVVILEHPGFQAGPTFPIFPTFPCFFLFAPTFPYFFLKMPYYSSFFTLKCYLRVKIQKYFLARSDFRNQSCFSSGSPPLKHIRNFIFNQNSLSL